MSLPVTRRIARAALLVAVGAAPVVAAAGTATAAEPAAKALGGLTAPLDSQNTSQTLDHTARHGVGLVNEAGSKAATKLAPALVETAGPVVKKAMPLTQGAADKTESVVRPVAKHGITTNALPLAKDLVGSPQGLLAPAQSLLGGLPLGGR
ncbi:ATP-binding protein [Streptomyces decoyicus]|uniref:ATP-binding protein n=1 Tax=Streptomyces decoyicus TaxID=249567 RepID=UPI0006C19BD0|nr:ATP-binding protein [Streptomyces decoyicus]KOG46658.1 ATP-binding protein [Streptomyces decoyicus]QZY17972.1 ATP-binding protein [Streptomyces decoyicus]